jgi:hypothetical protein
MANSSFLTTFIRHRDPKLLWPLAAVASVLTHGLALGLVRTLAIQTPTLPEGVMAPLPIQLVALPPDQVVSDLPLESPGAEQSAAPSTTQLDLASEPSRPLAPQPAIPDLTQPAAIPPTVEPAPARSPAPPLIASPPVAPVPRPIPAPVVPPEPPANRPIPPRPTPPVSPAPVSPAPVSPAPVSPAPESPAGGRAAQGGQVVPVGLRLDPSGRDIPDTAPQLLGSSAIDIQPLASGCGFANLEAILAGMTTATVQMQIRVETSGDISNVRLLQSTGRSAVDDLVSCVVRQRLRLQPASSAGVPQLTDAYILDARIQFF